MRGRFRRWGWRTQKRWPPIVVWRMPDGERVRWWKPDEIKVNRKDKVNDE